MTSDSDAYATATLPESHRIFYQIDGAYTGRRIESYNDLSAASRPRVCP